jgi:hypothetical protein
LLHDLFVNELVIQDLEINPIEQKGEDWPAPVSILVYFTHIDILFMPERIENLNFNLQSRMNSRLPEAVQTG